VHQAGVRQGRHKLYLTSAPESTVEGRGCALAQALSLGANLLRDANLLDAIDGKFANHSLQRTQLSIVLAFELPLRFNALQIGLCIPQLRLQHSDTLKFPLKPGSHIRGANICGQYVISQSSDLAQQLTSSVARHRRRNEFGGPPAEV
jgi:hypothetical protein